MVSAGEAVFLRGAGRMKRLVSYVLGEMVALVHGLGRRVLEI